MAQQKHLDGKGEFIYDFKYDMLTFRIKDRDYKTSIELQNFTIDIDKEGFATGLRVFDASKVFNLNKYILNNVKAGEFKSVIEDNVITVTINFIRKLRNKPLTKDFAWQITTPLNSNQHVANSVVEAPMAIMA